MSRLLDYVVLLDLSFVIRCASCSLHPTAVVIGILVNTLLFCFVIMVMVMVVTGSNTLIYRIDAGL